ncbi:ATP-binding cassette domain-containing protein [Pseudooceanicola sp. 216_PA32_1]|uniref:ATP-binding cassette domain-containing protein n=1 Tax=Pseudooceanicola pacificus TaxID=2676438 RepID=A0A844WB80_9RHOB|nr:oligopeptide/dipeptide ABC transporter ATP-binding protein [Pseudooceanicola pacificus]MWB78363.1 ATP-binding cassette domain-containing protein [Pseudooceanicola pacificus]
MSRDMVMQTRDLVRHFPIGGKQKVHAVNGVSMEIAAGETLALVGESGCGKSSFARLIMGLDRPDSGSARLLGQELTQLRGAGLHAHRKAVQMIFQDPTSSLDPRWTAEAIVREPLDNYKVGTPDERRARVLDLLDRVGLGAHYAERYPHEMSGGQRQRLGIARALALEPRLLVADEPVSALDVSIRAQVLNLLCDLRDEMNLSLLFISHDIGVVSHVSDRVAVMYLGRVIETGKTFDVLNNPKHPYTSGLLEAVPRPHPSQRRERAPLDGDPPSPIHLPQGCAFRDRCPVAMEVCGRFTPALKPDAEGRIVACHHANPVKPELEPTHV